MTSNNYLSMIQGIRTESKIDYPSESQDRRMKFLTDVNTEFHRGDDGIWIAYNEFTCK